MSIQKSNEDIQLEEIFENEWQYNLEIHPEMATFLGDHRYNHLMSDISDEKLKGENKRKLALIEELESIEPRLLSEINQLNLQLFLIKARNENRYFSFKDYMMPITQMSGIHTNFHRLIEMMPFNKEKDFENYLSRIKKFPVYIDQTISLLKQGIRENLTVPKVSMADVPNQISRQLPEDYRKSSFYQVLENKSNRLSNELRAELEKAIENTLYPAFNKLKHYLENEYIPACRQSIGLSALDNGMELYEHALSDYSTTNLSAGEIHQIGIKEVERISNQINQLIKELGHTDFQEFSNYLANNPDFYFADEKSLLMHYRDFAKRVDKELPKFFSLLPRLPYGIEKIPDHQAPSCPTAFYMAPDINMSRAGIFYANTSQLETRPKYELEALTLHEAVPGHHLQLSLALEMKGLPEFRKLSRFTAYVEGWGLYSEKLGAEMGFYQNPYSKFGQLSFEIWRACRLVVDTGIHAFNWSRDQAIEYLQKYTGKSRKACEVEVDRYIVMPGQATSYKIGELKILELRKKVEEKCGDKFDIREFHHLILKNGAIPLNVLEEYVNQYLEKIN